MEEGGQLIDYAYQSSSLTVEAGDSEEVSDPLVEMEQNRMITESTSVSLDAFEYAQNSTRLRSYIAGGRSESGQMFSNVE